MLAIPFSLVTSVSGNGIAPSREFIQPGETATPKVMPGESLEHQSQLSQSPYPNVTQLSISGLNIIFFPIIIKPRVFYVSTEGNDNNPGTLTQPLRTILKATNYLKSGDRVIVLAGTYNEEVNITTSGIVLQAQGKVITKGVYISGNSNTFRGFTITDPTSDWGIRTSGNNNLIEGNEIYHTRQDGIWFFGSYNTFRGNYIHDILADGASQTHVDCFQTWGWNWDTTHVLIENNTCINNEMLNTNNEYGIISRGTSVQVKDITFRNNVFVIYRPIYAAFGVGARGETGISNINFYNNTFVNMSEGGKDIGIGFTNIIGGSVINNLIVNFGSEIKYQPYVMINQSTGINVNNNAVYTTNGIPPYGKPYPGDVWMKDPRVINFNGLDFHLQSNSPLINTGYNLGALVTDDFNGVTRPQGAGYDIGAYEFPAP